jgi:uncharacterized membrane protein
MTKRLALTLIALLAWCATAAAQQSPAQASAPKHMSRALKGAIIGAALGATTGVVIGNLLCDGAHCYISGYVKAGFVFGGIGAAVGSIIGADMDAHARRNPFLRGSVAFVLKRPGEIAKGMFVTIPLGP